MSLVAVFEDAARAHFANPPATWRIQPGPGGFSIVDLHGAAPGASVGGLQLAVVGAVVVLCGLVDAVPEVGVYPVAVGVLLT
jgi:hypothetical protein